MAEKTMETKVGIINFAEKDVLTEGIEMYFHINSLSEEWKEIVSKSIEQKKQEWDTKFLEEKELSWSEKGVDIICKTLMISIVQKKQKTEISYKVIIYFEDKENKRLEDDIEVEVDLSGYEAELKEEIKKALLEKFF